MKSKITFKNENNNGNLLDILSGIIYHNLLAFFKTINLSLCIVYVIITGKYLINNNIKKFSFILPYNLLFISY